MVRRTDAALQERLKQSRTFKQMIFRAIIRRRLKEGREPKQVYATILRDFLDSPTLDNVDRLCTVYGYIRVRKVLAFLDNMVFEEFFYGKMPFYPLWIKQFGRLLEAAKPRPLVKQLMTSNER